MRFIFATLLLVGLAAPYANAGPPFLTDDPEPVELHHFEFYTFSTLDRASDGYLISIPAFEFNMGAAPNLQLHVVAPMQLSAPDHGPTTYGIGDIELGAKYRFIQEKSSRPQIGVFPMVELPSGDSSRGLGNGTAWYKLPVWVQKDLGHGWLSYGGGGYVVNSAPGMRNHPFFGWQAQKRVSKRLTLGAEWFNPGRASFATGDSHLLNFGGFCELRKNFSLLFTGGHSIEGDSHTIGYLGLYWTWGKENGEQEEVSRSRAIPTLDRFNPLLR